MRESHRLQSPYGWQSVRKWAGGLWHYRVEIVGLLVASWGLASFAVMLGLGRTGLVARFANALFAAFGVGAPAVSLSLIVLGSVIVGHPRMQTWRGEGRRCLGLLSLWLSCLVAAGTVAVESRYKSYGGILGQSIGVALRGVGGLPLLWVFVLGLGLEGLHLTLGFSWRQCLWVVRNVVGKALRVAEEWLVATISEIVRVWHERMRTDKREPTRGLDEVTVEDIDDGTADAAANVQQADVGADIESAPLMPAEELGCSRYSLPPVEIFDPPSQRAGASTDEKLGASIIEDTLAGFGIPARVVEVQRGPTVTRYGVQPGYVEQVSRGRKVKRKVRVRRIKALADDLALALAAAPIRVEAPIPGKPLVGIEVPNSAVARVTIRELLQSAEYERSEGRLKVALGRDISGKPVIASLERMPHLLIAGATGSGKSVCISAIIASLLYSHAPDELQLVLMDPKRVELVRYNGIPHLAGRVEVEVEGAIAALRWACREMDRRYELFAKAGVRDLTGYNAVADGDTLLALPRLVIIVDELADLIMTAPDEVERLICRLAQMARATGIHLVMATQRPSVDVVTGLIKANFPARISFAVSSQVDSRVILDSPGAEALVGRGDMLYLPPDSSRLIRLQGPFVSEEETQRLVAFWRDQVPDDEVLPVCPWSGLIEEDEEDELFDEAVSLAREVSAISASYLQRRLRIGYPRAARILNILEEAGIVGPALGGGKSRPVLINQEADENEEIVGADDEQES